jgi:phage terminase large subunit-like protein
MSWQPAETRAAWLDDLPPDESRELEWFWPYWARPAQQPPSGAWHIWLVMAGRGFGKTRTGAEWVREQVEISGRRRIALVAETAADAREVMVEGPAGILASSRTDWRPKYEPSKRRLTWPNGAIATTYSADKPGQLRGPQHDAAWADELAKWRYPDETWSNLMFGLRMGDDPRCVVTTTPRPIAILDLLARKATGDVVVTTGSTYENAVNLAPPFLSEIIRKYEGTRLGRQELLAELLTDTPGALWTLAGLDATRVPASPDLSRVVVAIDPAATSGEDADETGIIVAGKGIDGHGYVLADLTCRLSPDGWARRAVAAYHEYKADRIVA